MNHTELGVPGLVPGASASALAAALVASVNGAGIPGASATVVSPTHCLRIDAAENLVLTLGAFGAVPTCPVTPGGCAY